MSLKLKKWNTSSKAWNEIQTLRSGELVDNAGFERAAPFGWTGGGFGGGTGAMTRDTEQKYRGLASLKLTQDNQAGYYMAAQHMVLTSDTEYDVSCRVRIKAGNVPSVRTALFMGAYSTNLQLQADLTLTDQWQFLSYEKWNPGADADGELMLIVETDEATDAIVYFDDVSICKSGAQGDLVPNRLTVDHKEGRRFDFSEVQNHFYDNSYDAEDLFQLWKNERLLFQGRILDPKCDYSESGGSISYEAEGLKGLLGRIPVYFADNALRCVYNAQKGDFDYSEDRYERSVGRIIADILSLAENDIRTVLQKSAGAIYTGDIFSMDVVPPMTEFSGETIKSALDKIMAFQLDWGWLVRTDYTEEPFGGGGFGDIPYGSPTERIIQFVNKRESPVKQLSLLHAGDTSGYGFGENGFGDIAYGSPESDQAVISVSIQDSTEMCFTAVELQGDDELETYALWNPNNPSGSYLEPDWDQGLEPSWSLERAFTPGLAGSYGRVFRFFKLKEGTAVFPEGSRVLPTRAFGQEIVLLTHHTFVGVTSVDELNVAVPGTVTPDGHIRLSSPIWQPSVQGDPTSAPQSKYLLMRFMRRLSSSSAMTVRVPSSSYEGTAYTLRDKERLFTWYSGAWKHQDICGVSWAIPAERKELLPSPWNGFWVLYDPWLQLPDWYDPVTGADPLELLGIEVTVSGIGTYIIIRYMGDALLLWDFPGCPDGTPYTIHLKDDSARMTVLAQSILDEFKDIRYIGQIKVNWLDWAWGPDKRLRITDGKAQWDDAGDPMDAYIYRVEWDLTRRQTTIHVTPETTISPEELARRLFREDRSRLFEFEHFTTTGGAGGEPGTGGGPSGDPSNDIDVNEFNIWL